MPPGLSGAQVARRVQSLCSALLGDPADKRRAVRVIDEQVVRSVGCESERFPCRQGSRWVRFKFHVLSLAIDSADGSLSCRLFIVILNEQPEVIVLLTLDPESRSWLLDYSWAPCCIQRAAKLALGSREVSGGQESAADAEQPATSLAAERVFRPFLTHELGRYLA